MRRAALVLCLLALAAGCGEDDPEPVLTATPTSADDLTPDHFPGPRPNRNALEPEVIRGWLAALNAERYEHAASFFAPGAVVEQVDEFTLDTKAEAVAFNAGLPCRGEVADIKDEGATSVAAFRLEGPRGECGDGGVARVRFLIDDGLIHEWRQLPDAAPAEEPGSV